MLWTAYILGLEPTLLSQQFKTLVKVQHKNGVRLIEGERYLYLFYDHWIPLMCFC